MLGSDTANFYTRVRRRLQGTGADGRPDTRLDRMRTVYLGTSPFAVAVLERLAQSDHKPRLVVTRPDRPRGRGRKLSAPPVADAARELGIEVIQPESVNSDEARAAIAPRASSEFTLSGWITSIPSARAASATGGAESFRPRPRGRSGRVTTSCGL